MIKLSYLQGYIDEHAQGNWKADFDGQKYTVQCVYCHSILAVKYDPIDHNKPSAGNCTKHYNTRACKTSREAMAVADGGGVAPDPVDRYAK